MTVKMNSILGGSSNIGNETDEEFIVVNVHSITIDWLVW